MSTVKIEDIPFVEIAVGLNLIYDIVEKIRTETGVELTPENIAAYVAQRKSRREQLNEQLGVKS